MEDFFELLIAELEQYLTEDECAYPVRVLLNNDVAEERIAVRKGNAPTGPTIRVDKLKEAYYQGKVSIKMAVKLLINLLRNNESQNIHVPYIAEYTEEVAKRIQMMFVSKSKNKKRLERGLVPFVSFGDCDLAGTFFVHSETEDGEPKQKTNWVLHISYEILDRWGCDLDAEKLFELAMGNMNEKDDFCILATLDADILNLSRGTIENIPLPIEMYVVSTRYRNYGASAILAESVRAQLRDVLQTDKVFVLPSSVHETIVVRYQAEYADMFRQMVRDVNREVVDEKEILSDDIWVLDLITGELVVYKESEE